MEFDGVFSAVVAAVLISIGVGGDWARWTAVRNDGAFAQVAPQIADVAYKGPGRVHDNAVRPFNRGKSRIVKESASSGTGASPGAEFPLVGCCSGASVRTVKSASESRSSGVTIASNFSLKVVPTDNNWNILTREPAE